MYHLLISGNENEWRGHAAELLLDRCLNSNEYTASRLVEQYCQLTPEQNQLLTQIPAVFGYESIHKQDARLGRILSIEKKGRSGVKIEYEFHDSYPPIPNEILDQLYLELDISNIELHRNHWALKNQDLNRALQHADFPEVPFANQPLVNVFAHDFEVALSFPGEVRPYIEAVAKELVHQLGNNSVFYDNFYKSQLAKPNLDTALQQLYRNRAKLIVVFLSEDYASKKWCGIEFRAIREIINAKQDDMVMFVRFDNAEVEGVFSHDGYINANDHSEIELASFIHERVQLNRAN